MYGFDRTYGVGAPFTLRVFSKTPSENDLVHIFDPLSSDDSRQLAPVVAEAGCWVRVAPKVGQRFERLDWLTHLHGCSKLWLDLTEECNLTIADVDALSADVRELLLPYRKGSFCSRVSFGGLQQLERLSITGALKNLHALRDLVHLRTLHLFRAKLQSLDGIEKLTALRSVVIERSTLDSFEGIGSAPQLEGLSLGISRVKNAEALAQSRTIQRLELAASRVDTGLVLPSGPLKYLRLAGVTPPISLAAVWGQPHLEYLCNDEALAELRAGFRPPPHPALKKMYIGPVDNDEGRTYSALLGVPVAALERELPFGFLNPM